MTLVFHRAVAVYGLSAMIKCYVGGHQIMQALDGRIVCIINID
jgi:hypothetical protein